MRKTIINNLCVALALLVMGLLVFCLQGCEKAEPVICQQCIALEGALKDSMSQTDRVIVVAESYGTTVDKLKITIKDMKFDNAAAIKLANRTVRSAEQRLKEALTPDPNEPPLYGQGDPPAEYQAMFGNDNGARLDYVQNQVINRQGQAIAVLAERVMVLEIAEPNDMEIEMPDTIEPPIKQLASVDDYDKRTTEVQIQRKKKFLEDHGVGVACPKCGAEMIWPTVRGGIREYILCLECKHQHYTKLEAVDPNEVQ